MCQPWSAFSLLSNEEPLLGPLDRFRLPAPRGPLRDPAEHSSARFVRRPSAPSLRRVIAGSGRGPIGLASRRRSAVCGTRPPLPPIPSSRRCEQHRNSVLGRVPVDAVPLRTAAPPLPFRPLVAIASCKQGASWRAAPSGRQLRPLRTVGRIASRRVPRSIGSPRAAGVSPSGGIQIPGPAPPRTTGEHWGLAAQRAGRLSATRGGVPVPGACLHLALRPCAGLPHAA